MTTTSSDIDLGRRPGGNIQAIANTPGLGRPQSRRLRQLSIVATLALSFGGLVVVALGIAITLLLTAANSNTRALIATNGQLVVDMVSQNLRYQLDPTESQLNALGRYILTEPSDLFENGRLNDLLLGTLAADEQIDTLIFVRSDLRAMSAGRNSVTPGDFTIQEMPRGGGMFRSIFDKAKDKRGLFWGTPFYSERRKNAVVPVYMPVWRGGTQMGVLRATVGVAALSRHIAVNVGTTGAVPFALNADGYVIAHPEATPEREAAVGHLLRPADLADRVLADFRPNKKKDLDAQQMFPDLGIPLDFKLQQVVVDGEAQFILYKTLNDYAPPAMDGMPAGPWIIGLHLPDEDITKRLDWIKKAGILGGVVMLAAVVMSILIGRRIARPMARLALASEKLAELKLEEVDVLRGSRLREVDVAISAFNRMRIGLTWLATYVPRSLVPQLIRGDSMDDFASKERAVTVLFTDIVDFSRTSQRLDAQELAAFLNRHFSLLDEAISEQGGTIDKYIGDSVMAFWGAPSRQPDHVQRACRAALRISEILHQDNQRRAHKGLHPVRVRIGIETGIAIAGNIGAPGRVNYTLVGDSVNLAQRFEQFGKVIDDHESDTVIVISADVAAMLPPELSVLPLGDHLLPGRSHEIPLYRLLPAIEAGPAQPVRDDTGTVTD
ncbi:MAG TPA: adenylate/guanylate cyclase domain-containing protein [Terriglobales bacterium]|nr:adenylate/guanylate cyclase domain-containing protein [Terriglobales bacterium]